jgi:hypothetical protein
VHWGWQAAGPHRQAHFDHSHHTAGNAWSWTGHVAHCPAQRAHRPLHRYWGQHYVDRKCQLAQWRPLRPQRDDVGRVGMQRCSRLRHVSDNKGNGRPPPEHTRLLSWATVRQRNGVPVRSDVAKAGSKADCFKLVDSGSGCSVARRLRVLDLTNQLPTTWCVTV